MKKYTNPPLVEAVFEFFYTSSSWSPVIPGMFFNEIKDKFPVITQNQGGFGFSIDASGVILGGGHNELTQYKNITNDTIIQLSGNLLTVNKLPKYSGWESYLETITYAINALNRVIKVDKINRIGLKAINKIDIKNHTIEQFKYHFNIYPTLPVNINSLNSIQINIESPVIENKEILAISLNSLRKEPNYEAPVMFQIYVTRIIDVPENIIEWTEQAHKLLYTTFDNSLTIDCKNNF